MSEEWCIGYAEGYQAGQNEASAPTPSTPAPVACEHCKCNRPYHDLDCPIAIKAMSAAPPTRPDVGEARDAARYRWLRDQNKSLETRQYDEGTVNGPSCYHEVEGIRELKWGDALDKALDAALLASTPTPQDQVIAAKQQGD